ncbi:MAG: hypothetical protein ABF260_09765 [Flavobacteriaceae bacterium]
MNKKIFFFLSFVLLSCFTHGIFGQNFSLKIIGLDSLQTEKLASYSYITKYASKIDIYKEIGKFHKKIKKSGFLTSVLDTILLEDSYFTAVFNLGKKTEEVVLIIPKDIKLGGFIKKTDSIKIRTNKLEEFTNSLLTDFDKKGNSFSEITYTNPRYINNVLYLDFNSTKSKKRLINKVIVKGYEDFPESYIKNYFQIYKNTIFSKQKITDISKLTKDLNFISERKKPEVLFKTDSTHLYLFLEKIEANSFEGMINFASKDNGQGLLINGKLDLKLSNVFNTGENLELFWNRVAEEKSQFKINARLPYIVRSPFSAFIGFDLYRQDSTFLNTKFDVKSEYQLNTSSKIAISYASEQSNYLLNIIDENIESFTNSFIGITYDLKVTSKNSLFNNILKFNISAITGNRKSPINKVKQLKFNLNSIINIKTSKRSYVYLRNDTGYLNSSNYLTNELFRIGGINSIRSINEQSVFTNKYSFLNIEYRYITSSSSYLYSISDIAYYNTIKNSTERLLGLGLGYNFKINSSKISLGYINGINQNNSSNINNSRLIVQWTTFF